ncbi:EAL domain-containing protein [Cryptosporangium sp. NPDC048952]|uniref:EAL domain-containing protein n=1 Tax=Cryptosporangium sp. NPDC048952 TaxID=3363961 RepID=UPI00371BE10C
MLLATGRGRRRRQHAVASGRARAGLKSSGDRASRCVHSAGQTQQQRRYGENAPAKISVNVSARQLADLGFVDQVQDILRRTGADAFRLVLEVTETAVLTTDVAIEQLTRLRALRLRVALDDFGTGHSSLSLLLDYPVDVLKVDNSIVGGASAEGAGAIITKNLIGFINDFGMEGVKTAARRWPGQGHRDQVLRYLILGDAQMRRRCRSAVCPSVADPRRRSSTSCRAVPVGIRTFGE